jgi:RimJ/RimL family protein N-acetyltransferase
MSGPTILPEVAGTDGELTVCRWTVTDAAELGRAVEESRPELLPWMPFAGDPPLSLEERVAQIDRWASEWAAGGDCIYGIFVDGRVAGSCGLHRRLGADGLEIGYWLHPDYTGRGIATRTARLLSTAAFTVEQIELVEIHHDRANTRSAGVPRRLGYELVGEFETEPVTPGDSGVEWRWRMTWERWDELRGAAVKEGARPASE